MGSLIGHVAVGFGYLLIGLWHLFNHIKLHVLHSNTYVSSAWFPVPSLRYLELFFIGAGSITFMVMELFVDPSRHQPFDTDGTIPSYHLHSFEHASISMSFLIYAAFAVAMDQIRPKAHKELTQLLEALAFAQEFLLFHLHSTDHMGVEGQYHFHLQIVILVSLITTLMGIGLPNSFTVSFVRSASIFFQGVWSIVVGFMLWTPDLIPKGCFMNDEDGHYVVRCSSDHALHRAKSLVNLEFSWYVSGVAIFSTLLYLILVKIYGEKVHYRTLRDEEEEDIDNIESLKKINLEESKSFAHVGKGPKPMDIER